MAGLAYLLPPLSGLVAYAKGRTPRVRFHGLQAIIVGVVWPAATYAGAILSPGVTQGVFALGAAVWLGLVFSTAAGHDIRLPGARILESAAQLGPGGDGA
jgi:hypothetical protein